MVSQSLVSVYSQTRNRFKCILREIGREPTLAELRLGESPDVAEVGELLEEELSPEL